MIKYQYQLIRYIHDQFTGEFVNVGIVLFSPEENFLRCRAVSSISRIAGFFGSVNSPFLLGSLKHFETQVAAIAGKLPSSISGYKKAGSLEAITSHILPKNDSVLQLTAMHTGIDLAGEIALDGLYCRIIGKYNAGIRADAASIYE